MAKRGRPPSLRTRRPHWLSPRRSPPVKQRVSVDAPTTARSTRPRRQCVATQSYCGAYTLVDLQSNDSNSPNSKPRPSPTLSSLVSPGRNYKRLSIGRPTRRSMRRHSPSELPSNCTKLTQVVTATESTATSNDQSQPTDEEDEGSNSQRRYPMRNRRSTDVYQVRQSSRYHHHHDHHQLGYGTSSTVNKSSSYDRSSVPVKRIRTVRPPRRNGDDSSSNSSSSSDDDDDLDLFRKQYPSTSSGLAPVTDNSPRSPSFYQDALQRALLLTGSDCQDQPIGESNLQTADDPDERRFARRQFKRILKCRSELLPMNFDCLTGQDIQTSLHHPTSKLNNRLLTGSSLANIEPMQIDSSIGFDQVGGHEEHINCLRESVLLPLVYPELFAKFNVEPPRGILFSGPPGTGKTMLARALANECSRALLASSDHPSSSSSDQQQSSPSVAFFMRKGADCLSKWVGESERQLRLLFDQAYRMRPSIIFFDELDGLAPVRSSGQDQIHSSIVSTLLGLMDGIDRRDSVVIIGATNRPDALDPALRRPGRFDREFAFTLPSQPVRARILHLLTCKWDPRPSEETLQQLASITTNFSGADIKGLVTEACLACLRRSYPQVYTSRVKLSLNLAALKVSHLDWLTAMRKVRPFQERANLVDVMLQSGASPDASALAATKRQSLPRHLTSLVGSSVDALADRIAVSLASSIATGKSSSLSTVKPRLLLTGDLSQSLVKAVWQRLENVQIYTVNTLALLSSSSYASTNFCIAQLVEAVRLACSHRPTTDEDQAGCLVYLPEVDQLIDQVGESAVKDLVDQLDQLAIESTLTIDQSEGDWRQSKSLLTIASLSNPELVMGNDLPPPTLVENGYDHSAEHQQPLCNGGSGCGSPIPPPLVHHQRLSTPNQMSPPPVDLDATIVKSPSPANQQHQQFSIVDQWNFKLRTNEDNRVLDAILHPKLCHCIGIQTPSRDQRSTFFYHLLTIKPFSQHRQQNADDSLPIHRPPSPQPAPKPMATTIPSSPSRWLQTLTDQQLLQLDRHEDALFRRLRQSLRRVVAYLTNLRRFHIFARPVQLAEAPDYYAVIRHPVHLGLIRDKIDGNEYTSVDHFMQDIRLIHANALEYNPVDNGRGQEILRRAAEFLDEAVIQVEDDPQLQELNVQCKAAHEFARLRKAKLAGRYRKIANNASSVALFPSSTATTNIRSPVDRRPPLPSGGRFSRRLHGQVPQLDQDDIAQLESVRRRGRRRRSRKRKRSKVTIESDNDEVSKEMSDQKEENSNKQESPDDPDDANTVADRSPIATATGSTLSSPTSSTGRRKLGQQSLSSPQSTIQSPPPRHSQHQLADSAQLTALTKFHQSVVNGTHEWGVDRLTTLYAGFANLINCFSIGSGEETAFTQLLTDLHTLFAQHR